MAYLGVSELVNEQRKVMGGAPKHRIAEARLEGRRDVEGLMRSLYCSGISPAVLYEGR